MKQQNTSDTFCCPQRFFALLHHFFVAALPIPGKYPKRDFILIR